MTAKGRLPISAAEIEVAVCPLPNQSAASYAKTTTDADGFFSVANMCAGGTYVWVAKPGYRTAPSRQCDGGCLHVTIDGDTRFDIDLVPE